MKTSSEKKIAALLLVLITALGFYSLLYAYAWGVAKFFVGLLLMGACGIALRDILRIEGEWGMLLVRTKKGLGTLDSIAHSAPGLWVALADVAMVVGFGLCSIFIFRQIPRARFVIGMIALVLFSQLILPAAAPLAIETINLPAGSTQGLGSQTAQAAVAGSSAAGAAFILQALFYLVSLSTLVGGLVLTGIAGLALKAFTVLLSVAIYLFSLTQGAANGGALSGEAPGATFVLPGINLPFVEGILALAVLLVVHECSHGVLARAGRLRVKSAGLVFFGIIPAGAFVDPDEKQLMRADVDKQNRVLVAGSGANMAAAAIFLCLLMLLQSAVLSSYPTQKIGASYVKVRGIVANSSADGFISPGDVILSWKGQNATTLADFKSIANGTVAGDVVEVRTDKGTFHLRAGEAGKVGVSVSESTYSFSDWARAIASGGNGVPLFLFNFVAISFVLNVLVGIINLFPIPPFDGSRIVSLAAGKKKLWGFKLMDLIVYFVLACFLLNLLPWAWS